MRNYLELLGLSDTELVKVDPVEMNLLVAKSIPSLEGLDIGHYQRMADRMAEDVRERFLQVQNRFQRRAAYWKNDINFFRLGVLYEYLDRKAGIKYKKEHEGLTAVRYADPSDLFLNGIMDTRYGTCGSMATLYVVIARRLGWPVSLSCAREHHFARYDDGKVQYCMETSWMGHGVISEGTDEHYIKSHNLSPRVVSSGSDLRALTPRETLGIFVGLRARHMQDSGNLKEAAKDYLLARYLFPANHYLYLKGTGATLLRAAEMYDPGDEGHPLMWADSMEYLFGRNRIKVQLPEYQFYSTEVVQAKLNR